MPDPNRRANPLRVSSTYGEGGTLRTTLPREGVDIGEMPDFWSDLSKLQSRFRPRAEPQMEALREARRNPAQLGTSRTASLGVAPSAAPQDSLDRRIMQRADFMAAQDPNWLGLLSSGNLRHKWLPYATTLEGINLPNGWDVYAQIAGAGGASSATAEAQAGENIRQLRAMGIL